MKIEKNHRTMNKKLLPKKDEWLDMIYQRTDEKHLVLYNDDINSFEHIIMCLIHYCKHEAKQAEQCAFIAHNNGNCVIKSGSLEELQPICNILLDNELTVKIE